MTSLIATYFIWKFGPKTRVVWFVILSWTLYYTFYSQVISGFIGLFGGVYFVLIYYSWKIKWIRYSLLLLPLLGSGLLMTNYNVNPEINQITLEENLESITAEGNAYFHDTENKAKENGHFIYRHISDNEISREWPKYSKTDLDEPIKGSFTRRIGLYRYMTSLGLKKDAIGLSKLSEKDIENIETGKTSVLDAQYGIISRLASLRFQLENGQDPNGSTLLQRFSYWSTGLDIIKQHWFIGVGTGDVQDAFDLEYVKHSSLLTDNNRLRSHQTYLTSFLTFGFFGLFLLLFGIYYWMKSCREQNEIIAFILMGVLTFSFFFEDTLETHSGVSLFGFVLALFLIKRKVETAD